MRVEGGSLVLGESLRAGLRGSGVGVTLVAPGFFESDMGRRWRGARPFSMTTDAAAMRIEAALRAGRSAVAFPWPLALGLRAASLLPARLADRAVGALRFRVAEH
ncbi:hypothetical protein ACE7GA_11410 [Roseomonas sp. CCTCC AB2023176]|uniref:hypothetical protein n=1 Tax=Roseomonas sp. CCTCC AB2023176 TaxID=3342640 RepID=UPI0035DC3158